MATDRGLFDRLQRADSWIHAASELQPDRMHEGFIFLYIAFNCLYGRRQYEGDATQIGEDLEIFLDKILAMNQIDRERGGTILPDAVTACRQDGIVLIRDRFLAHRYWSDNKSSPALQAQLNQEAVDALDGLKSGDVHLFLSLIFQRISVLRNQVMHGCATYGTRSHGRGSLIKALHILRVLIPAFYRLAHDYGHSLNWDPIPYPRLGSK